MYDHFSEVATSYNEIRTTDLEPVLFIKEKVGARAAVRAVDLGCGGGRYSLLLCQHVPGLHLICTDVNESMVAQTARHLTDHGIKDFSTVQADINDLQLPEESLDGVLTFNAVHHFDPIVFLSKAAAMLGKGGYVFIYTRLRSQNARSIWGRLFPGFCEKETRLYSLADIENWNDASDSLSLVSVDFFKYRRRATLPQLLHQAHNKHYSTFSLYPPDEFDHAAIDFERNLRQRFSDPNRVEWFDENVMIVFKKDWGDSG
jgi:SAM-dependent methyltransferase